MRPEMITQTLHIVVTHYTGYCLVNLFVTMEVCSVWAPNTYKDNKKLCPSLHVVSPIVFCLLISR